MSDLPEGWGVIYLQARPIQAYTACDYCLGGFSRWWDAFRSNGGEVVQFNGSDVKID